MNVKQEEVGRIKLSDHHDLIASIVNDEKLDLRIWVEDNDFKGYTKKGVRFYFFDDIWTQFKELMKKVDKAYEEIA